MTGEADQVRALTEAAFWAEHHRKRRDNPHEVAAGQVGAATVAGLAAHLADRVNPHGVTALQVALASAGFGYHPIWHRADTTTIAGLSADTNKWFGGVLGPDGKIYGIPFNSTSVLIIDPVAKTADTTTIAGLTGTYKWFGGVLGPDGKIYGIPCNSTSVLIIAGGMPALPIEPLLSPYLNKF